MMKTLTIVVPTYNIDQFLDQCLRSFVVPELMPELEVLVINDGSTDGSLKIAQQYEEKYPDVFRVITKENGGHGSTINRGIEEASGKYFKVVDGDDWVLAEGFKNLISFLKTSAADMILSHYYWVDDATGKRSTEVSEVCPGAPYGAEMRFHEISDQIFFKMHAITYKTEVLRKVPDKIDEHCYYVDMEYMTFPLPYVNTVAVIPDYVYMYRVGLAGQSVSIENMQKRCGQHEKVLEHLLKYYDTYGKDGYKKCMSKIAARVVTSQYKIYLSVGNSFKDKLVSMDRALQSDYPMVYNMLENPAVKLLRKTNYCCYGLVSMIVKHRLGGG